MIGLFRLRVIVPLLSAVLATATRINFPPELADFTGLSDAELDVLTSPSSPLGYDLQARADCPVNITSGGVFAGPGNPSVTEWLKRNSFVTRQGTKLKLLGEDFRIAGPNIYWLGLDENVVPDPSYPSRTRVLEAFADVSVMGGTAVRGHTLGISVGNPLSVEPSLNVFNNDAYESIDFAILAARVYGIKLLIPLVDNYNWYHGGKYQFIEWAGFPFSGTGADITPPDVGAFFYNNTKVINSFKKYIVNHLTHVNRYTGIALKDDPTILGWESGNELSGARFGDGPAPAAWTKEIGQLVKSLAPRHLFMDGSYGIFPETGQLKTTEVDIFGDHFYPTNISRLATGVKAVNGAGRNYLAGEFDWVGQSGGDPVSSFLSTILSSTTGTGDFYWSLFGHDDACCQYVEHDDGESFYWLRQNATESGGGMYITQGKLLADHAWKMQGKKVPTQSQAVACPQYKFPTSLLPNVLF